MWRVLCFAVLMSFALDFCDPYSPGVLDFDADRLIDAASSHVRAHIPVTKPLMTPEPVASPVVRPLRVAVCMALLSIINVVRVDLRPRGHLLSFAPASPDDH
jgi:hypothetical protein